MEPLDPDLRKKLKVAVIEAREVAEEAATETIKQIGVGEKRPPDHLDDNQRELRRKLRVKGRQLGDHLHDDDTQDTKNLIRETAYEHWHRMLFARFLAENDLLVHPEMEVSVSLEECDRLAEEEGVGDGFELAANFATNMLPEIFKSQDPILDLTLAPEYRQELKTILQELPEEIFIADDSLGWVYQFWQEKRKDAVNDSEVKIGSDELPAVTQLFTEHYMVQFLLDNTLGAWWISRHPEEEIDLDFEYLRTLEDGSPAAGKFEDWPDQAKDLEIVDPCMGSGHFLVSALPMVAKMRMEEEDLQPKEAVDAVLRDNLYGLEIDQRCTQIAVFALALAAWTFADDIEYRKLADLNIACCGVAPEGELDSWLELAGGDEKINNSLKKLFDEFNAAPTLGSLINPTEEENMFEASYKKLQPYLDEALNQNSDIGFESSAKYIKAKGIAKAGKILSGNYDLVITNVPYRKKGDLNDFLQSYFEKHFKNAQRDIATVLLCRLLKLLKNHCHLGIVSPQSWLFQPTYEGFRKNLLNTYQVKLIARIGEGGFRSKNAAGAFISLSIFQNKKPKSNSSFANLDIPDELSPDRKANFLKDEDLTLVKQNEVFKNPDSRLLSVNFSGSKLLEYYADSPQGIKTGDDPRYRRYFWELPHISKDWKLYQSSPDKDKLYDGCEYILCWKNDGEYLARRQGELVWGNVGAAVGQMRSLPTSIYTGKIFDSNVGPIVPKDESDLLPIIAFVRSSEYKNLIRQLDKSLKVSNATLTKVPFDIEKWRKKSKEMFPNGLPSPQSNDLTQWVFDQNKSSQRPLQQCVANLLGYKWPNQPDLNNQKNYKDQDGIICLPPVGGEQKAADRVRQRLRFIYGQNWTNQKEKELLQKVEYGKYNIDRWLRYKFFKQHCKLFNNRPFIWQIWDGKRDGFSALLNYHKLDQKKLDKLIFEYLGQWIRQQERAVKKGEEGAEDLLIAANELKEKLELIKKGEPPYNIFVRWKSIGKQPLQWNPDLDDGVRMNIRPFYRADILRHDFSINWNKDRGKEPKGSYWWNQVQESDVSVEEYNGERYNRYEDYPHTDGPLTNEMIRKARKEKETQEDQSHVTS